ncbi:MAG: ribosome assembly RNA-binding protein YhbY [Nitrosomonas sp.]|nr:ribosome assembly RNA-binding protein YhbY [Nitrosomonas sp.]
MPELNMARRRLLAASAHHLNPVVMIGKGGLTEAVMSEIDNALTRHELIKIKVMEDDRVKRLILLEQICQALDCAPISRIGKILVVYRRKPEI